MTLYNEAPSVQFEDGLIVERVCPKCFRYIKSGSIIAEVNGLEQTRVRARCAKCGDIEPDWEYL